jgi:hypothetical protein
VFKEFWIAEILVNRGRTCNTKRSNTGLETSVCTSKRLGYIVLVTRVVGGIGRGSAKETFGGVRGGIDGSLVGGLSLRDL